MLRKIFIALGLFVGGLLIAGRVAPLPSTLMVQGWLTGDRVERSWRPIEQISPNLIRAVIASEDQRFCQHWGVDFDVLRQLINDPDGPARGGSTLSMQTVKNLFLWHGRSYVRKAMEIPLALAADAVWGKKRMIELYLNVAEWGDGIYGAEAAAQHHYRKPARSLTPVEAARLAVMLPNPRVRDTDNSTPASRRVYRQLESIDAYVACVTQ